jgi:phage shock protein PspC (stress-responsive transcriptional regulator)
MNKTTSCHISGINFQLEEEAFSKLKEYIHSLRIHFSNLQENEEVLSDIEARIAEMLHQRLNAGKQVILLREIDEVIATMGSPEQLSDKELKASSQTPPLIQPTRSRIYRDPDDAVIAGVCSGIAAHFQIDPIWPRLIFAISLLCFGSGILIYIILAISIPKARTSTQKLEMRGRAVTISSIENSFLEKPLSKLNQGGRFRKCRDWIERQNRTVVVCIGTILLIALCSLLLEGKYLFSSFDSKWFFLIALFVLIFSFISRRSKKWSLFFFFCVFISFLTYGLFQARKILNGGNWNFKISVSDLNLPGFKVTQGDGIFHEEKRDLPNFTGIDTNIPCEINVRFQEDPKIEISGDKNIVSLISTNIDDGTLSFALDGVIQPKLPLKITIGVPTLDCFTSSGTASATLSRIKNDSLKIEMTGATKLTAEGKTNRLDLDLSGTSHFQGKNLQTNKAVLALTEASKAEVHSKDPAQSLEIDISGTSEVTAEGGINLVKAELSGASHFNGKNLRSKNADLSLSGTSEAQVYATEKLDLELSGASHVQYYGKPPIIHKEISGSSSLDEG